MEVRLRKLEIKIVKESVVYRVAPNRSLESWAVIKEGKKAKAKAKGLSKSKAVELGLRLARKQAQPAVLLVHKTRYIVERKLQLSAS
jgi:hypothetical protein